MFCGETINYLAKKNTAYTLFFPIQRVDNGGTPINSTNTVWANVYSQNGGSFTAFTNTPVNIGSGWYSLNITAAEMNADKLLITIIANSGFTSSYTVEINTYSELSSAPSINDNMLKKISAIFQYLFLKRTVTATQEKLYKADDTTVLATGTLSDDSTTFTKGKPA